MTDIDDLLSSEPVEKSNDPFHPDNVQAVQLITLMRIYDVLMGLYKAQAPVDAKKLFQWHEQGFIAGPLPWYSGEPDAE